MNRAIRSLKLRDHLQPGWIIIKWFSETNTSCSEQYFPKRAGMSFGLTQHFVSYIAFRSSIRSYHPCRGWGFITVQETQNRPKHQGSACVFNSEVSADFPFTENSFLTCWWCFWSFISGSSVHVYSGFKRKFPFPFCSLLCFNKTNRNKISFLFINVFTHQCVVILKILYSAYKNKNYCAG